MDIPSFKVEADKAVDGTVLVLGVQYEGSNSGRIYSYALLKVDGRWYSTGGNGATAASWGAVEKWLARDGRELVSIDVATGWGRVWPSPGALVPAEKTVSVDTLQ